MRPYLLKVSKGPDSSFSVRQDLFPINNRWHYHAEVELIHIKKGEGTKFIGDNISRFKSGDVVIVGKDLPHYWRFDEVTIDSNGKTNTDVMVAHFTETFWGEQFLHLPENINIRTVLEKAKRGLDITGKAKQYVADLLQQLMEAEGLQRIVLLMEALSAVANCKQPVSLSSIGFKPDFVEVESDRINAIYEYSIKNFRNKIQLEEIAEVANISPNSFCRYFKSRTRKTYSQFLIELRVGHACKLLIENNQCIKRLCYESGFNNFTSFHKYFKMITGKSPLIYQKEFISSS
jgi:AraC-like DNA-binding protein